MKKLRSFLLVLFVVAPAFAQDRPTAPASQAEVNAGTIHSKFVAPDTLAGFASTQLASNVTVRLGKFLPNIFTGTGLLCPVGNSVNLFTNTLSYGTTNLHVGDNIVYWNGAVGSQFEICDIPDAKTIRVFELILTNTAAGGGAIIASNSWYQVYQNAANLWDVNGEQADYTGHTHGSIASDGGLIVAAGPFRTGWSYGVRFMGQTNNARITMSVLGTRGPVMDFEAGGFGAQNDPFYWSLWAPYESLGVMSNGLVAVRSGFTNNFAPLITHNATTNQFGDGVQAILRGPDSNFQLTMREGANRWNRYDSFGDTYSGGGAHRFYSLGGGAKLLLNVAQDYIYMSVPPQLAATNFGALAIAPGANDGTLINSNKVLYWVTATKTNLISDGR